jgi:hypothetical protein
VFAHNLGFDARIVDLFGEISRDRYSLFNPAKPREKQTYKDVLCVLDDPPTLIKLFRKDGQELMFCDTFQIAQSSLRKIGEVLKYPKLVMPTHKEIDDKWWEYCQRDVDVLDQFLCELWDWLDRRMHVGFKPTVASQARHIYRMRYEDKRIAYDQNPAQGEFSRLAYYGGRTDLWRKGEVDGPIYQVDVNSLYPYVMHENYYPCKVLTSNLSGEITTDYVRQHAEASIAEVYLDTRDFEYPVKNREGCWYVGGRARTVLAGPELDRAFRHGEVIRTTRFIHYQLNRLFDKFVADLYTQRMVAKRSGDSVRTYLYKIMLNSLYGKFGQQTGEWVYYGQTFNPFEFSQALGWSERDQKNLSQRVLAGHEFRTQDLEEAKYSYVPIAAFVTSYARVYMDSIKSMIPDNSYYYQATDSLYVNEMAYNTLGKVQMYSDYELGKLKTEGTYDKCIFRNIHNIDKDDKEVRGSVRPTAKKIGPEVYATERWDGLTAGIFAGRRDRVHIVEMIKVLTPVYNRRIVLPDGSTRSHEVKNWEISPEQQRLVRLTI